MEKMAVLPSVSLCLSVFNLISATNSSNLRENLFFEMLYKCS